MAWSAESGPVAQVKVAALRRGTLNQEAEALGDVRIGTAQRFAIAFPRNVQVSRLYVYAGETVHRGQALIGVKGAPGTDLAFAQARAAERFAKEDLARTRELASRQLATRVQVTAAEKALADANAQLAAANAQQLGRGANVRGAPFDGIVTAVTARAGGQLAAGTPALVLSQVDHPEVVVGVSPDIAGQLRIGQAATLQAVFDGDQQANATVQSVAGMVDSKSHLVDVVLKLSPTPTAWMPGLPVQASFALRPWTGWVVPRQAVLRDEAGQAYVFQDDNGKARRVDVSLEIDTPTQSGIAGALNPTLPIVVLGNYELTDGMALKEQG